MQNVNIEPLLNKISEAGLKAGGPVLTVSGAVVVFSIVFMFLVELLISEQRQSFYFWPLWGVFLIAVLRLVLLVIFTRSVSTKASAVSN